MPSGELRARGVRELWLEVLVQNKPAIRLYEKLGFEHVRELEVWTLDELCVCRDTSVRLARAGARTRIGRERAARAVAARRRVGQRTSRPSRRSRDERGALVFRIANGDRVSLLQGVARDADAARDLLGALPAEASSACMAERAEPATR